MPYDDIIEKHANRVGVDASWLKKIMRIESGGNAKNITGSYKGLFQLSSREFVRHGGSGNILDPEQNTMAAANKMAQDKLAFKEKYGRDPSLGDLYMVHQQGEGGFAEHSRNPDRPAWQNMLATGEGQQKGEKWAKKAIWGNIPDQMKRQFGSVDNVTSRQFMDMWGEKLESGKFQDTPGEKGGLGNVVAKMTGKDPERGTIRGSFQEEPDDEPKGGKTFLSGGDFEGFDYSAPNISIAPPNIQIGRFKSSVPQIAKRSFMEG